MCWYINKENMKALQTIHIKKWNGGSVTAGWRLR